MVQFQAAFAASQEAAQGQNYPKATLYVVATPIGNLADITLRALYVLQLVDFIACEDTRHTLALLQAYGLNPGSDRLLALHQHNEREAAQSVLARLQSGARVAYVSDAGTPAISDPGAKLVSDVAAAGFRVTPLPGACCVTAALSVAGLAAVGDGWVFDGFLPLQKSERLEKIAQWGIDARAVVLLEAPHRMVALAKELSVLGPRSITVCRELTKQFEEVATLSCELLTNWVSNGSYRGRGEFVLVLHPLTGHSSNVAKLEAKAQADKVLKTLLKELPLKTAVMIAADLTGLPRNALYQQALDLKGLDS
jgi:16S rRNA (cytidine1402-2'-O)-methyltransferase